MQKELTIKLSEETYNGLIELVGAENASQFIEAALRPHIFGEEYEVKLPLNNGQKKIYLRSPHLVNRELADRLRVEIVEER